MRRPASFLDDVNARETLTLSKSVQQFLSQNLLRFSVRMLFRYLRPSASCAKHFTFRPRHRASSSGACVRFQFFCRQRGHC